MMMERKQGFHDRPAMVPELLLSAGTRIRRRISYSGRDDAEVALNQFPGKTGAVTLIFAGGSARCPILTAKMACAQTELGSDFGAKIALMSIAVDPESDTPDVLRRYARTFGDDPAGRKFLTGSPSSDPRRRASVRCVAGKIVGQMDHTNLTSLAGPRGMPRVHYPGLRFYPDKFRRDLLVEKPGLASNL
jgi:protein SCO1